MISAIKKIFSIKNLLMQLFIERSSTEAVQK